MSHPGPNKKKMDANAKQQVRPSTRQVCNRKGQRRLQPLQMATLFRSGPSHEIFFLALSPEDKASVLVWAGVAGGAPRSRDASHVLGFRSWEACGGVPPVAPLRSPGKRRAKKRRIQNARIGVTRGRAPRIRPPSNVQAKQKIGAPKLPQLFGIPCFLHFAQCCIRRIPGDCWMRE